MKILVYADRDWSFKNIAPVLSDIDYKRISVEDGSINDIQVQHLSDWDLIITCEPHIDGWKQVYPLFKGKLPILALQQGPYWGHNPKPIQVFADRYLVWGEYMYSRCANIQDRVVVTGNPRFDAIYDMKPEDHGYTLILGSMGENREHFKDVFSRDERVIIKLHPGMQKFTDNADIEELIRCAGKVVFAGTGAGLQALIMKKPVEIRESVKKPLYFKYPEMGDKYIQWMCGKPGATERVRKVIENEISRIHRS